MDTGATYTVMPTELVEEVGAVRNPFRVSLGLGDGRMVEADVYMANIEVEDREGQTLVLTFRDAKTVIGVRTLEDLGLNLDPIAGKLEPTRPKGVAYFY